MITPFFAIDQDDEYVHVDVKVSHARFNAEAIEMVVDGELFVFALPPYYLRLRFPHDIVDDERATARFEGDSIKIKLPKAVRGQNFPDLDLAAKLLARSNESSRPLIEELNTNSEDQSRDGTRDDVAGDSVLTADEYDWEIKQTPASLTEHVQYGFNNLHSGIVGSSLANGNDINEVADPERTDPDRRVMERLIGENIKFDPEIYAADYIMEHHPAADDDKQLAQLLAWKNPYAHRFLKWYKANSHVNSQVTVMPVEWSSEEQRRMQELPQRLYIVDDVAPILCFLANVLFAYHFDLRASEGEHTVESAWTVGKLVPQFSHLDAQLDPQGHDILRAAVFALVRRALAYPLHRSFSLVMKVWDDVYYNLRGGKRHVIQALLDCRELFRYHDVYYVYDKIWMEQFCAWFIADALEGMVRTLAHDLKREVDKVTKDVVTFEKADGEEEFEVLSLREIEEMAEEMYAEQRE